MNEHKRKQKRLIRRIIMMSVILFFAVIITGFVYLPYDISIGGISVKSLLGKRQYTSETPSTTIVKPTHTSTHTRVQTAVPTPGPTASLQKVSVPEPEAGDFSATFPASDTDIGKLESYQSENVRISIDVVSKDGITYYVADIWVRNIALLKTAFAEGSFGTGNRQDMLGMSTEKGALIAISGDYYGARTNGVVIRNGKLYRETLYGDVCVIYKDGALKTYSKDEFDVGKAMNDGAWQAWSFGPKLLENGNPVDKFRSAIKTSNPRCAIGYYEPGHYCFILVDGRQEGYSRGMTLSELSGLAADLGLKDAYNLDGGQTAAMVFDGKLVNKPYNGGRKTSDMIYISE